MAATLNEYVAIDNPLDYHTFIWNQRRQAHRHLLGVLGGGFDVAMLILDMPTHPKMKPDTWMVTARALMNAADATKARAAMVATPCRRHAARSGGAALGPWRCSDDRA